MEPTIVSHGQDQGRGGAAGSFGRGGDLTERLIGFDARVAWETIARLWDSDRVQTFLYREDVSRVYSVDDLVWPSPFHTHQCVGMAEAELERLHLTGPALPDWIGPNVPLWENLEQLKGFSVQHADSKAGPHALLAFTALDDPSIWRADRPPYFESTVPDTLNVEWKLLGYDIADGAIGVSGLSNCGFGANEDAAVLKTRWGPLLNDHHLFARRQEACAFRSFCDGHIPEHAPFWVTGVYLIE